MPDEDLLRYIEESTSEGRSEDIIRALLLQRGWSQITINEAFAVLKTPRGINSSEPTQQLQATTGMPTEQRAHQHNSSAFNVLSYRGRVGRLKYLLALSVVGVVIMIIATFTIPILVLLPMGVVGSILGYFALLPAGIGLLFVISLPLVVLASSIIVKRFHDLGKSGIWWLAMLVPLYNLYLAVELASRRGDIGLNKYGEDPVPPPNGNSHKLFYRLGDNFHRIIGDNILVKVVVVSFPVMLLLVIAIHHPQQNFNNAVNRQPSNLEEELQSAILPVASATAPAIPQAIAPKAEAPGGANSGVNPGEGFLESCGFTGKSYAQDIADTTIASQMVEAHYDEQDLVFVEMNDSCGFGANQGSDQGWSFYSTSTQIMYSVSRTGETYGFQTAQSVNPSYCPNLSGAFGSSAAVAEFVSSGGAAGLSNALASKDLGSLSVQLACLPDGKLVWEPIFSNVTEDETVGYVYSAATGQLIK